MEINLKNSIGLLSIGLSAFACKTDKVPERPKQPNILFIMSDDHAFQAISA